MSAFIFILFTIVVDYLQYQSKRKYFTFASNNGNNLQTLEKKDNDLSFDFEFLNKLIVGIGEVSQITGIATRQIRYWEEKGIIVSLTEEEGKNRRYDYRNVKKMLLIKELLEEGYTLDAAAEKIKLRMELIEKALSKLSKNKLPAKKSAK